MLALEQAREIAAQEIAKIVGDPYAFALIEAATIERPYGWVFFYQSRRYLESGDELEMLSGNGPLIVRKSDGAVSVTGTAFPIEHYLSEYEAQLQPGAA